MKDFIKNKIDGEIFAMKRSAITGFNVKLSMAAGRTYIVHCSDGMMVLPLFKCPSSEEAEAWVDEQLAILEEQNEPKVLAKEKPSKAE